MILSIIYGRRGPTWKGAVEDIYSVMDPWSESESIPRLVPKRCCICHSKAAPADFDSTSTVVETGATPPVDFFPFLKKLPDFLSPWRKKALKVRQMELDVSTVLLRSYHLRPQFDEGK